MKRVITITILSLFVTYIVGQEQTILEQEIKNIFKELAVSTNKTQKLWDKNLYGHLLLIDPETREIYANMPDSAKELKLINGIYEGNYPKNKNFANTSVHWNGDNWSIVLLPLPTNKYDRISLLAHERFHVIQSDLGFTTSEGDNQHLDTKEGRIYLRLELEALKQALTYSQKQEILKHLTNAFIFRSYRQSHFRGSKLQENNLELNEGLAEYTGEVTSGRPDKEKSTHFINSIDKFMKNATFIRSFAYQTIPVYGYLLDKTQKGWNKKVNSDTNLTDFFENAFQIVLPDDLQNVVDSLAYSYNYALINNEEVKREDEMIQRIADYKQRFVEQPHFDITLEKMNISFNPMNLISLAEKGTVYPTLNITDNWGVLSVTNGALLSSDWRKISISNPKNMDGNKLSGDGWTLILNEGYIVTIKDGSFRLKKQ